MLEQWMCQTLNLPRRCNCSQNIDQRVGKRFLFFFLSSFFISLRAIYYRSLCPIDCVYIYIVRAIVSGAEQSENRTAAPAQLDSNAAHARAGCGPPGDEIKLLAIFALPWQLAFRRFHRTLSLSLSLSIFVLSCSFRCRAIATTWEGARKKERKRLILVADNSGRIGGWPMTSKRELISRN